MKIAPSLIIQEPELLPELRDLFHEHPFLAHCGPEAVRRTLRVLRGLEADVFAVEVAMEALRADGGEVLA